jgi:hypothetical protein
LGVLAGLLLCVAGIVGVLVTGLDLLYGAVSLCVALIGGGMLVFFGRAIRTASRAEAEGAPGRRSKQKPAGAFKPLDRGQRL